jgi:glycogen operon protein
MFCAGDEFLNTQGGNNNPYNQDNETTWLDWSKLEQNRDIFQLFQRMIALRKAHPAIARGRYWREAVNWYGILVPAKTPREIIARLNEGILKSLGDKDLRDKMIQRGSDPITDTPDQFASFLRADMARWAKIVKTSGIKVE